MFNIKELLSNVAILIDFVVVPSKRMKIRKSIQTYFCTNNLSVTLCTASVDTII